MNSSDKLNNLKPTKPLKNLSFLIILVNLTRAMTNPRKVQMLLLSKDSGTSITHFNLSSFSRFLPGMSKKLR